MSICKGGIDPASKFRILCNHPESDCTFFEYFDAVRGLQLDPLVNIIGEPEQFTKVLGTKNNEEVYRNDKAILTLKDGETVEGLVTFNNWSWGINNNYYFTPFTKALRKPSGRIIINVIGNKHGVIE